MEKRSFLILPPAGSGSKGDEGMLRGALNVFSPANFVVINPQSRSWIGEIGDSRVPFAEVFNINEIEGFAKYGYDLIVVGADVIDGSGGVPDSMLRLDAIEAVLKVGAKAYTFFSFRSDVRNEIVERLKTVAKNHLAHFFPRDPHSFSRFGEVCGPVNCKLFPDLAFYCGEGLFLAPVEGDDNTASAEKLGKRAVALNFSEHSFRASKMGLTNENRILYMKSYLEQLLSRPTCGDILLVTSDLRRGYNFWSDHDYALAAEQFIQRAYPDMAAKIFDPTASYSSIIERLRSVDLLVTGRMHLAVAAVRARCVPVIVTGHGLLSKAEEQKSGMRDKAMGMLEWCLGRPDFVVTSPAELGKVLEDIDARLETIKGSIRVDDGLLRSFLPVINALLPERAPDGFNVVSGDHDRRDRFISILKTERYALERQIVDIRIENYTKGFLHLARRLYHLLPLGYRTRARHRRFVSKFSPRVLMNASNDPKRCRG